MTWLGILKNQVKSQFSVVNPTMFIIHCHFKSLYIYIYIIIYICVCVFGMVPGSRTHTDWNVYSGWCFQICSVQAQKMDDDHPNPN